MKKFRTFGRLFGRRRSERDNTEQDSQSSLATKSTRISITHRVLFRNPVFETAARFEFLPIDITPESRTFRLLNILPPDSLHGSIKCDIIHSSLDHEVPYDALSYAWNEEMPMVPIYLQGRVRLVTHDLRCALLHLRLPDKIRTIWIDVLCIDQDDICEKSHQVRLIRGIYQGADHVVAWLGEDGPDVKEALEFCDFLVDLLETEKLKLREHQKLYQGHFLACEALFFRRPWWRRQWTITEVCHDKPVRVYIGLHQFTIEEIYAKFETYIWWLKTLDDRETDYSLAGESKELDFTIIMRHRSTFKTQHNLEASSCTLLNNLHLFRGRKAQDSRDHLFAHFGLCSSVCGPHVIDYVISKEALYTQFTRKSLSTSALPLFMVDSIGRTVSRRMQLPSCVPDYSYMQTCLARAMINLSPFFNAGMEFPPKGDTSLLEKRELYSSTDSQLTMRGIVAATVTKIYSKTLQYPQPTVFLAAPNEQLTAILFDSNILPSINADMGLSFKRPGHSIAEINELNTSWGPLGTEVGDIVIVAEGSGLPLVLRRHNDKTKFLFVGACVLINFTLSSFAPGEIAIMGSLETPLDVTNDNLSQDPGFSPVMHGALCRAALDGRCFPEQFLIE